MTHWKIDESHLQAGFKYKHLMITNVSGYFTHSTGNIQIDSEGISVSAKISFENSDRQYQHP